MKSDANDAFERLKAAHDRLFSAYLETYKASRKRRLVRRLIGDHLSRQTGAVRWAYVQASEGPFKSPDERAWLDGEAERLQNLQGSFAPRRVRGLSVSGLSSLLPVHSLLGLIGASSLVAGVLAFLGRCLCELTGFVPLLASIFFFVFLVDAFNEKRKLFLATATGIEGGIYGAEDSLFMNLNDEKQPERRADVAGWCLIAVAWLAGWAVREWAVHHNEILVHGAGFWIFLAFAGIALAAGIVAALRPSYRTTFVPSPQPSALDVADQAQEAVALRAQPRQGG
jgi:hypothetical protein